ncbi:MAG: hypothetical protein EA352_10855 [Gemmatimonadales bacterium]|nr:MAG: hypothetical protein EA352_10855 [Gemmatimonadales bacterium]
MTMATRPTSSQHVPHAGLRGRTGARSAACLEATGRRTASVLLPLLGLLVVCFWLPVEASAQNSAPAAFPAQGGTNRGDDAEPCPEGRISEVFVDNHSIFDPASIPEDRRLTPAYRLANRIHMRTREDFIRAELLVREGDCLNPALLRESARILRAFRFIAEADVFHVPQPDGSHHVVVDTRDEWSTKLAVGIRVEDGLQFDGASMVEENFLGRGAAVGVTYLEREERREAGVLLELPRIRRSGWDLALEAGRTRVGPRFIQGFEHPFQGKVGHHAFRQWFLHSRDLYTWRIDHEDSPWSHVVLPLESGLAEMTGARRFGAPGGLLLLGGGLSREWVRTDPGYSAEGVVGADFGNREPLSKEARHPLATQLRERETTRVNLLAGIRRVEFRERRGLDALTGVQDVPVGREVQISLGPSLGASEARDAVLRLDFFGGMSGERSTLQVFGALEGRRLTGDRSGTRDILAEGHAFLYRQFPGQRASHTLLLRGAMQSGWRVEAPFQLGLGGPDGVRGISDDAIPGGRRFVLSLEDRVALSGPFPDLLDAGLTVFADMGRMYAGDVPWGRDSPVMGTVGAGLRIGFPAGSSSVIRLDLAFPVGPGTGRTPVFRIHAREWLGILDEFRSTEMEQVRRSGVRGEFPGVGTQGRRRR